MLGQSDDSTRLSQNYHIQLLARQTKVDKDIYTYNLSITHFIRNVEHF